MLEYTDDMGRVMYRQIIRNAAVGKPLLFD
jgi:hypothetical protein